MNGEEQGGTAAGNDTMKTVMRDNNTQPEKFTVLCTYQCKAGGGGAGHGVGI